MNGLRAGPTIGIAGCLCYLCSLVLPYGIVETTSAVGAYYASGVVSPWIAAVLALLLFIILAAGRQGRTDPGIAAGAGVAVGVVIVAVSLLWAVTVPNDLVLGLTESALIEQHRLLVVAVGIPIPLGSVWFARSLGVV
jgi:hypothetical protein